MLELYARAGPDDAAIDADVPLTEGEAIVSLMENIAIDPEQDLEAETEARGQVAKWLAPAGLTTLEINGALGRYNELMKSGQMADQDGRPERQATGMRSLQALWGDDYDGKYEAACRAVCKIDDLAGGNDEFIDYLDRLQLNDDPYVIAILADVAARNNW